MTTSTTSSTVIEHATAAPNWSAMSEDVACPLCEYNLRGLVEPRCPECGYRFEWSEVLEADKRPHPFLFEHHPRRNVWSFVRTKLAGLRPWKFWRSVKPTMPSSPQRLLLYWLLSVPLIGVVLAGGYVSYACRAATSVYSERARIMSLIQARGNDPAVKQAIAPYGSAQKLLDAYAPTPFALRFYTTTWRSYWNRRSPTARADWAPGVCVAFVAWPWLTAAALFLFQASMRRAQVRAIHVMRAVLYSCDGAVICAVMVVALVPDLNRFVRPGLSLARLVVLIPLPRILSVLLLACTVIAAVTLYKLGFAFSRYLRFAHPWSVVFLSQVLVILTILVFGQFWLELHL